MDFIIDNIVLFRQWNRLTLLVGEFYLLNTLLDDTSTCELVLDNFLLQTSKTHLEAILKNGRVSR